MRRGISSRWLVRAKAFQAPEIWPHRLGLSDGLLLLPEHRIFVDASVEDMVARLRKAQPEKKLVSLVSNLEEAMAFALAGSEILQLDHFTPEGVRQAKLALHNSRLHPMLAVSGGVNAANAVAFADAGADVPSCSTWLLMINMRWDAVSEYMAPPMVRVGKSLRTDSGKSIKR